MVEFVGLLGRLLKLMGRRLNKFRNAILSLSIFAAIVELKET